MYIANFGKEHFLLNDIRNIHGAELPYANMSWASFPCQDLSLAGPFKVEFMPHAVMDLWEWLRVLDEMVEKPKILVLGKCCGVFYLRIMENYKVLHYSLVESAIIDVEQL